MSEQDISQFSFKCSLFFRSDCGCQRVLWCSGETWRAGERQPRLQRAGWVGEGTICLGNRNKSLAVAPNKVMRVDMTAGETVQIVCCMCRRGRRGRQEGMRKCGEREGERTEGKGESGVIVGRLTTPHDLIVMLKTAGEAGRRVGGRDASHRILQRCVGEGGTHSWPTLCKGDTVLKQQVSWQFYWCVLMSEEEEAFRSFAKVRVQLKYSITNKVPAFKILIWQNYVSIIKKMTDNYIFR